MRIAPFVPAIIITAMMGIAYFITVTFENQVSLAVQQSIARQMPFMSMPTGGNLVVSLGSFLLATLAADIVITAPLLFLGRRAQSAQKLA